MGIPGLQRRLEPYTETLHFHHVHSTGRGQQDVSNESSCQSINRLAPNATGEISTPAQTRRICAILDGPGLAYHAYNIAFSKTSVLKPLTTSSSINNEPYSISNSNSSRPRVPNSAFSQNLNSSQLAKNRLHRPFNQISQSGAIGDATPGPNATPSSTDVVRVLLTWMEALTSPYVLLQPDSADQVHDEVEIIIAGIVFDGGLPLAKREERETRLKARVAQLVHCKKTFPGSSDISENDITEIQFGREDLNSRHVNSSSRRLPFPPWIAAAAFEGLKISKWADLTFRVPGEADPYCAGLAAQHSLSSEESEVLVLTSDSDLLAYDLGPTGQVVFYKDVEFSTEKLRLETYPLTKIARRLISKSKTSSNRKCSPTTVAYCISRDVHISDSRLADMVQALERDSTSVPAYPRFRTKYQNQVLNEAKTKLDKTVEMLDPSLSEVYHFSQSRQAFSSSNGHEMVAYLPLLQEDPTRASAWRMCLDIRQLAYSLLLLDSISQRKDPLLIYEISRRGTGIGRTRVTCSSEVESLLELVSGLKEHIPQTESVRELALRNMLTSLVDESKPLPIFEDIPRLLAGRFVANWYHIHNLAQMQATMYSYRMLLQASSVFLTNHSQTSENSISKLVEGCKILHDTLESLGFLKLSNIFDPVPADEDNNSTDTARNICNEFGINEITKSQLKKLKETVETKTSRRKVSSNPYDVLDEE